MRRAARASTAVQRRAFFGPFKKKEGGVLGSLGSLMPKAPAQPDPQAEPKEPRNGALGLADAQVAQLKRLLEQQKGMTGDNAMTRTMQAQVDMMERMMKKTETDKQRADAAKAQAKANLQGTKGTKPKAVPGPSKPSAAAAVPAGDGDLGEEIESLFAELKAMRGQRNTFKADAEAKAAELATLNRQLAKVNDDRTDLRNRLRRAEQDVALLNSEAVQLKDKARDAKQLEAQLNDAQRKLKTAGDSDAAVLGAQVRDLRAKFEHEHAEAERLRRKVQRGRRSNPLAAFSGLLGDAAACADAHVESAEAEAAFQRLRDAHDARVEGDWPSAAAACGAQQALVATCRDILHAAVPHSNLDAEVHVAEASAAAFEETVRSAGLHSERHGDCVVVTAGPGGVPEVPPALLCRALQLAGLCGVSGVRPVVSPALLGNAQRTTVEFERSRSSKPGGQAANVSETHVGAKLLVDGTSLARAESQDTRSSMANEQTAEARVRGEKVVALNKTLRAGAAKLNTTSGPVVDAARWAQLVGPAVPPAADHVGSAVVAAVRGIAVRP